MNILTGTTLIAYTTSIVCCALTLEIYSVYYSKFYGQAERAISNGQLNVLLRLHIRPINVVVYDGPTKLSLGKSHLEEGFALICIQRLS